MTALLPPLRDEERTPDTEGGVIGCDCGWCRELRLRDDDRIVFTARDVAQAWQDGFLSGITVTIRRGDERSPVTHEGA